MKKQLVGFHSLLDLRLVPGIKRFKRLQIDISAKVWIYMQRYGFTWKCAA